MEVASFLNDIVVSVQHHINYHHQHPPPCSYHLVANMSESPRYTVMSDPSGKSILSIDAILPETLDEKRKRLNCEA
eukprot:13271490-Ditylum_brightwellii.AAC.1